ncbi:MAG: rod shape-determining protein MreC [bacterium]|nr:rod shape-determining protein MreC [bacterium]
MRTLFQKGLLLFVAVSISIIFSWGSARYLGVSFLLILQKPFVATSAYLSHAVSVVSLYVQSKDTLKKENEKLKEEVGILQRKITLQENMKQEYEILLGAVQGAPQKSVIARVIPTPTSSVFGVITIDKGSEDGVRAGAKAVFDGAVLLGFVEETFAHASRVRLFSSFHTETQLKLGETNVTVLAVGEGGGVIRVTLPRDFPVAVGDRLFAPGAVPFLVGFVDTVGVSGAEATRNIYILTPLHPGTISFISLIP